MRFIKKNITDGKISISKEIEIDYGHRVPNHKSKCRNFHGHRGKIRLWLEGEIVTEAGSSDEGMLVDFGDVKRLMMEKLDALLDHGFIMYEKDSQLKLFTKICDSEKLKLVVVPFIPTAENLAKYCFNILKHPIRKIYKHKLIPIKLEFYETPTSVAVYEE